MPITAPGIEKEQCLLVEVGKWEGGFCEVQVSEEDQFPNWGLLLKKIRGRVYGWDEGRATLDQ